METFERTEQHKQEGTRLCFELKEVCDEYGREPFTFAALIGCASVYVIAGFDIDEFEAEARQAFNDAQQPGGLRSGSSTVSAAMRMEEDEKAFTPDAARALAKLAHQYSTFVYFHTMLVNGAYLSLKAGDSEGAFAGLARHTYWLAAKQHTKNKAQA